MKRRGSLVGSLFGRVGLLFVALIVIAGLLTYRTARDRIDDAYDGQLIVAANVLQALMTEEINERVRRSSTELAVDDAPLLSNEDRKAFDAFADWRMFRIWHGARKILQSDTGPTQEAVTPPSGGFKDVISDGLKWRTYTLQVPASAISVEVGERLGIRSTLARSISVDLALPLLLLIPATALLIWLALNNGLKALRALISELGRRSAKDLTPLEPSSWPSDLISLVRSINQLMSRIDRSLQRERRFIDQAAHQLRTPLTVIKLQAQLITGESRPEERAELAAKLDSGVDRASSLVQRLLTLARLESISDAAGIGDLAMEAKAAMADLAPLAEARQVPLAYEGEAAAAVAGDATLLRMICANLLDNAIRYSPPGGEVHVRLVSTDDRYELRIVDDGPGIPAAERPNVLERFNRGKTPTGEGVGLGLSIVSEALRLLNGRLDLLDRRDGKRGLEACVSFPRTASGDV